MQLSNWVENIVGQEEIAHYQQFLLFPQCFQKLSFVDVSKWVSMEKGWLVVMGFNTTLIAEVISWQSVTHMCFLAFSHQY